MQYTDNYNLKKPEYNDFADIVDISDDMEIIDETLASKLDKTGDASDAKVSTVTASTASYPVPAANDTFKVILGKISKFFTDIKTAFVDASISGKTITLTKANGDTKTLTTQDTWNANSKDVAGYVRAPTASNANKVWKTNANGEPAWRDDANTTYSNFTKATADAAGKAGLVPAPAAGKQASYLRGDGTWNVPTNTWNALKAATASANGTAGYAPAPTSANFSNRTLMYLRSDATWQYLPLQNNATTTAEHYALDARMGKTLNDKIDTRVKAHTLYGELSHLQFGNQHIIYGTVHNITLSGGTVSGEWIYTDYALDISAHGLAGVSQVQASLTSAVVGAYMVIGRSSTISNNKVTQENFRIFKHGSSVFSGSSYAIAVFMTGWS